MYRVAQRLRKGRCEKTIGFFSLDVDLSNRLSSRTRQLQIIQAELSDRGYTVPVYVYGYRGRDVLENHLELINTLITQRPLAIICNTSGVLAPVLERLQNFVTEGGITVCYGYSFFVPVGCDQECDQVVYAEGETFYLATRHLLGLGHRDDASRAPRPRRVWGFRARKLALYQRWQLDLGRTWPLDHLLHLPGDVGILQATVGFMAVGVKTTFADLKSQTRFPHGSTLALNQCFDHRKLPVGLSAEK